MSEFPDLVPPFTRVATVHDDTALFPQPTMDALADALGGGGTVPDATPTAKGVVQLAGDLGGTAAAPTVPGLAGKAPTGHTHAAADLTSGTIAPARLGTGTPDNTKYLRGDQTWAPVPAGGSSDAEVAGYIAAPASASHAAVQDVVDDAINAAADWHDVLLVNTTVPAYWTTGSGNTGSRTFASDYVQVTATTSGQFLRSYYNAEAVPGHTTGRHIAIDYDLWISSVARSGSVGIDLRAGGGVGGFIWCVDASTGACGWVYESDGVQVLQSSAAGALNAAFTFDAWNHIRFEFIRSSTWTDSVVYVNGTAYAARSAGDAVGAIDNTPTIRAYASGSAGVTARFRNVKVQAKDGGALLNALVGADRPSVIPAAFGQTYVDAKNGRLYIAVGIRSLDDWVRVRVQ